MLLTATTDFVPYHGYLSGTRPMIIAILENVTLILLLPWMVSVSVHTLKLR